MTADQNNAIDDTLRWIRHYLAWILAGLAIAITLVTIGNSIATWYFVGRLRVIESIVSTQATGMQSLENARISSGNARKLDRLLAYTETCISALQLKPCPVLECPVCNCPPPTESPDS